ncbi:coiled-coil domain-containing protein 117-like [Eucyclogobius newberryi]|uniref:coiled-coil domain-containing protein 117-like n=1 Tax=Eucyclogobius newberryi TaxID=166745 RepID=UPI003B5C2192
MCPSMYPFSVPSSLPEFDLGAQISDPSLLPKGDFSHSLETRCLRKHRRRSDDEVCSAKRRRLMESEGALSDSCAPHPSAEWFRGDGSSSVALLAHTAPTQPALRAHGSCSMEVEAAQRRLREIEDRITLEDDSDSELEVEVCPRRPVLVMSDSLKEGLQRGLSDILPHTVAQSVSRSCMELVLWRPPDDPISHRLKESLQKQRKQQQQQSRPRQPPTPCPSSAPHRDVPSPALYYCPATAPSQGEEDMEM